MNQIRHPSAFIEAAPIIRDEAGPFTRAEAEAKRRRERARRSVAGAIALQRNLIRIERATWILSGVGALLLALVVALVVISVQISHALSESRQIAQQLEKLDQFETRIVGRLDSFNAGLQLLIGKTNDAIYNVRDEVEQSAKTVREASAELKANADQLQSHMAGTAWQAGEEPPPSPVRRSVPRLTDTADQAPPAALSGELPTPSMSFRRIINPDGSTTYQKVR